MKGVIAYILSKKYTDDSLIGIGALKGANCKVKDVVKTDKTTTVTLSWKDDLDVDHDTDFEILDGEDAYTAGSGIDIDEGVISTKLDPDGAVHASSDGLNINVDDESIEIDSNELKAKIDTYGGLESTSDGIGVKAGNAIDVDDNGVNVLTKLDGGIISDPNGSGLMLDDSYFSKLIDTPLTEAQILNFVVENVNKEVNGFFYNSDINAYCSFSGLYMSKTTSGTEVHYGYCNIRGIHETEYLIDYRIDWEDSDNWYKVKIVTDSDLDDVYTKTETDNLLDDKVDDTDIITSFNEELSDDKIPSEKLVKNSLDDKANVDDVEIIGSTVNQNWQGNGYNLIPHPYYDGISKTHNGITYTVNSDGSVTANGTATDNSIFYFIRADYRFESGKKYRLSGSPAGGGMTTHEIQISSETEPEIYRDNGNGIVFTPNTNKTYAILAVVRNGNTVSNLIFKPMITEVDENENYPTEYQRYAKGNVELTDELKVKIPDAPNTDGTYTLKVTVTDGVSSYNWVSD